MRQSIAGKRAGKVEMWKSRHRRLDWKGDALFGFERRETGRSGVDLHLHVGDIWHSVDWQATVVPKTERCDSKDRHEYEPAPPNREID